MCPFCFATMGLIVAGAVSTRGLAALAVKVSRKNRAREVLPNLEERKNQNVCKQALTLKTPVQDHAAWSTLVGRL
jgi:hypothetical protein